MQAIGLCSTCMHWRQQDLIASITMSCRRTVPSLMTHLGAVRASEAKLDVRAVGLQDIPGAVLKERVEAAMECVAPARRTVAWIT